MFVELIVFECLKQKEIQIENERYTKDEENIEARNIKLGQGLTLV